MGEEEAKYLALFQGVSHLWIHWCFCRCSCITLTFRERKRARETEKREGEREKKTTTNQFCQHSGSVAGVKTARSMLFMINVGSFVQIIQLYENFQLQLPPVSAAAHVTGSRQ